MALFYRELLRFFLHVDHSDSFCMNKQGAERLWCIDLDLLGLKRCLSLRLAGVLRLHKIVQVATFMAVAWALQLQPETEC